MFVFSFVCPLFYPYGQTEIFYKYDNLTVNYAQATERLDYTSYTVDNDIEIHYSVRNKMTTYIKQLEEAGGSRLDITGDDGNSYTIVRLGENVYTLNTAAGNEIAVYSGLSSIATYNSKIKKFTESVPVGKGFETAFTSAVAAKETGFESDGAYYFIISTLKNTYEALALSTGTMTFMSSDLGKGFVEAFRQGIKDGSFEYNGKKYTISGDPTQGFAISEAEA
jgi:hypothetical protein